MQNKVFYSSASMKAYNLQPPPPPSPLPRLFDRRDPPPLPLPLSSLPSISKNSEEIASADQSDGGRLLAFCPMTPAVCERHWQKCHCSKHVIFSAIINVMESIPTLYSVDLGRLLMFKKKSVSCQSMVCVGAWDLL